MSTRWYPRFHRGNPQLRVFLPNFWMRLMRPTHPLPPNKVQFGVSMQMTDYDVKNYLKEIYKIPVVHVRTYVQSGECKKNTFYGYVTKDDDVKMAIVTLPKTEKFEFPKIHESEEKEKEVEEEKKILQEMENTFKGYSKNAKNRPSLPPWFSI